MNKINDSGSSFSVIAIENYVRVMTAVKNIEHAESGEDKNPVLTEFRISKKYYEEIKNSKYPAVLLRLNVSYDEKTETMSVLPETGFLELYKNQIMRDVAFKQAEDCKDLYSKFIEFIR